jgi:hypothetical protein
VPWPPRQWTWLCLYKRSKGLFSRYREVPGSLLSRLVRMTVRFRARVASLPRWLTPKITISPLLRRNSPSITHSLALFLCPSWRPHNAPSSPPAQGSIFGPISTSFFWHFLAQIPPISAHVSNGQTTTEITDKPITL